MNKLYYKTFGEGSPLVILHGLFGMSDNWRSFSQSLADEYYIITVDLRNHGRSFHDNEMSYPLMAKDVAILIQEELGLSQAHILGHSMGGKVAMHLPEVAPQIVDQLIVVDIGSQSYPGGHEYIFDAMMSLPIRTIKSRTEAEEHLARFIEDKGVRLFLMKNLKRKKEGGYQWKMNLEVLYREYSQILGEVQLSRPYVGPILFVKGDQSSYIRTQDQKDIKRLFPTAQFSTIEDAGHWVHADAPVKLREEVRQFLK